MATVSLNSAFFTGLQDSNGDSPVLTTGSYLQLHQRTASPPALPTITNSVGSSAFFHNEQDATAGWFTGTSGSPTFGAKGLRLTADDGILGVSWLPVQTEFQHFGTGTYWSEGIVSVQAPLLATGEVHFDALFGNAYFGIKQDSLTTWRFFFTTQTNATTATYFFDSITVPLTQSGVGAIPKPFYFRILREMPSTGTGQLHLVVNDGTTTQTQTITGLPLIVFIQPLSARLTFGNNDGIVDVYWWRGIGSDDPATVGTLTNSYWSSPKVFDTVSYFSHGTSSTADAGTNDQYWHSIGITPGDAFSGLTINGGGKIEARVAATNTAPTGSTSSLFSGSYFPVQEVPENLNDPQGRYLALEWKYTPGTDWPLSSGSVHIVRDTAEIASASYFPTSQGSNPSVITVAGEGTSQGTLPYTPEKAATVDRTLRTRKARFSYPYTHSRPLGTVSRRSYKVRWVLTSSEKATLLSFFEARDGIEQAFTWTAPGDSSTSLAALASNLDISQLFPGVFQIDAVLKEVK